MSGAGRAGGIRAFCALARMAALESLRSPAFLLVACVGVCGIALLPVVMNFTLGDGARMVADAGLSLLLVCGMALGILGALETVGDGLGQGRAAALLSKPVGRGQWLAAQAAGVGGALALYGAAAVPALLASVRSAMAPNGTDWGISGALLAAAVVALALAGAWNHRTRRPFSSAAFLWLAPAVAAALAVAAAGAADVRAAVQSVWPLAGIAWLAWLPALVAAALAAAFATRLSPVAAALCAGGLLSAGLMADWLLGARLDRLWAQGLYALLPNLQAFWLADAWAEGLAVPGAYLLAATLHAACYAGFALALGAWGLRSRDVG